MIISASRRTDIPAFYSEWFMNRIREGYCTVPNPFNTKQVARISLKKKDVDVIVFWTRDARPLMGHLNELNDMGLKYYFLYTLLDNPPQLDPGSPPCKRSIDTFLELARRIGREKVVWRYDPIVFSEKTDLAFHTETFHRIAGELKGSTDRCVISLVDIYRKAAPRFRFLGKQGLHMRNPSDEEINDLLKSLSSSAKTNEMKLQTCAEENDFTRYDIPPGKCIDDQMIRKVFDIDVTPKKDPSQRAACGCVASRDIGMYDTCLFGCVYCYATTSFDRARERYKEHDPESPSLSGHFVNIERDNPIIAC